MNYTKPEVKTLGEAKMVIEGVLQKPTPGPIDNQLKAQTPGYDLDE